MRLFVAPTFTQTRMPSFLSGPACSALVAGLVSSCAYGTPAPAPPVPGDAAPSVEHPLPPGSTIVTSDDLERTPTEPIEKVLQARVPGVFITRHPDGSLAIRLRGTSTAGSSEPLYVIDDIPINPGPNGSLTGLNPYDIASIEIVKDATGMAMYGSRGGNGVIIIRTKRPNSN